MGRPSLLAWVISAPLFSACGLLLPLDPDEPIDAALAVDASHPPDAQSPLDGGRPEAGPPADAGLVDASVLDSSVPDGSVVPRHARSVSAGALHTCATVAGGDVFCWGSNGVGQLGDGTFTPRWSPAGVGIAGDFVGGSSKHTCAIAGGDVSCWGDNAGGQLGDGTVINRPWPVPAGVAGASQLCGGDSHTCAVLTGGMVGCWGSNLRGAIGSGILGLHYRDAQIVPLIPSMAEVTCGAEHTCARSASGFAACWGRGREGQLGEARMVDSAGPVSVRTVGAYVTDIDAGGEHTCAVSGAGTVYCWGRGTEGQLGTGSRDGANVPALVGGITAAVEVSAAAAHTCARLDDGSVICWGENGGGQLGTGDRLDRLAPGDPVVGLTDAIAISTGEAHSCALLSTGSLVCWGLNGDGRLGDGSTRDSVVPVEVAWP